MDKELHQKRREEKTTDHGSYYSIETSRGDLLVSKKDFPKIKDYTWLSNLNPNSSPIPYAKIVRPMKKKRDYVYPHWIIYGGNQDFYFLNHNTLDLRRENVMCGNFPVTVRGYKNTLGTFPNVRQVASGKWMAQIRNPEKGMHYIGVFESEKAAAEEVIHNIKLFYPTEAKKIIATMKALFANDAPAKSKEWGWSK